MKILEFVRPTKSKIILFTKLFFVFHLINLGLMILVIGFWDGPLTFGFPVPFYLLSCGMLFSIEPSLVCPVGLNIPLLLFNILFWYLTSCIIRAIKH